MAQSSAKASPVQQVPASLVERANDLGREAKRLTRHGRALSQNVAALRAQLAEYGIGLTINQNDNTEL